MTQQHEVYEVTDGNRTYRWVPAGVILTRNQVAVPKDFEDLHSCPPNAWNTLKVLQGVHQALGKPSARVMSQEPDVISKNAKQEEVTAEVSQPEPMEPQQQELKSHQAARCPACSRVYYTLAEMKKHLEDHSEGELMPVQARRCG